MLRGLVFLALLGTVCGALLHFGNLATADAISSNRNANARLMVAELTNPEIAAQIDLESSVNTQCPDWVLLEESIRGYAGEIDFLIFMVLQTKQISVRTKYHRETPGIGDFIDTSRDPYLFDLDRSPYEVWSSIDRVTGATITHAALQRAVTRVRDKALKVCSEITDG